MDYRTIQGRDYFAYSYHKTAARASEALEEYFATDQVCGAEQPTVERIGKQWAVMFPAN